MAIAHQTGDMRHDRMISGSSHGHQDATPARGLAPGMGASRGAAKKQAVELQLPAEQATEEPRDYHVQVVA
jgi:hypothetical protein